MLRMSISNLLLTSPGDPASGQIVGRHLQCYLVTGQDLNKVHSELAGNVCQNGMVIAKLDFEHSIGQCIGYDALKFDYVVFCQDFNLLGCFLAFPGLNKPDLFVIRR